MKSSEDTTPSGKEVSVTRPLLNRIYRWGGAMTALCFGITLIWGFELTQLLGFGLGYAFLCGQFEYFGRCCENAVRLDRKAAIGKMRACYAVRISALILLSCAAAYTGFANFTGILIPQLFPKIILTADGLIGRKG